MNMIQRELRMREELALCILLVRSIALRSPVYDPAHCNRDKSYRCGNGWHVASFGFLMRVKNQAFATYGVIATFSTPSR